MAQNPSRSVSAQARGGHGTLWTADLAQRVLDRHRREGAGGPVVCASGISPSGPIHMGNLREVLSTHLVCEAIRGRGADATHLHSWDDYDRLRKVPAGVAASFERYIGMPLCDIPDPHGEFASWADRHIEQFLQAARTLGVQLHQVRQSERYRSGAYNPQIRRAMDERALIFDALAARQTRSRQTGVLEERRATYYPFKPYCEACGHDFTTVTDYTAETVTYRCACGHSGQMSLADGRPVSGKLVWKVDWPMRWSYEHVLFEPAGEDHHAPTASFTVGREIVRDVFAGAAPESVAYSFVSLHGQGGKMSSSAGQVAIPADALAVLEPAMVRWLYARRTPNQSFAIDLSPAGVQRLYDEWDAFCVRAQAAPGTSDAELLASAFASSSAGELPRTPRPVSFRLLASVADITQADPAQMQRILAEHLGEDPAVSGDLLDELRPRLDCAVRTVIELTPPEQRTVVRERFDTESWTALEDRERQALALLADGLPGATTLQELTTLVYAVPKRLHGLPDDAEPTPELKREQREFFKIVYRQLIGAETGPRLPTLLLSVGVERALALLVPAA